MEQKIFEGGRGVNGSFLMCLTHSSAAPAKKTHFGYIWNDNLRCAFGLLWARRVCANRFTFLSHDAAKSTLVWGQQGHQLEPKWRRGAMLHMQPTTMKKKKIKKCINSFPWASQESSALICLSKTSNPFGHQAYSNNGLMIALWVSRDTTMRHISHWKSTQRAYTARATQNLDIQNLRTKPAYG